MTDATVAVTSSLAISILDSDQRLPGPNLRDCDVFSLSVKMSAFVSNGLLLATPLSAVQSSKDVAESTAQFMSNGLLNGPIAPDAEAATEDTETLPNNLVHAVSDPALPLDGSIASSSSFVSNGLLSALTPTTGLCVRFSRPTDTDYSCRNPQQTKCTVAVFIPKYVRQTHPPTMCFLMQA